MGMGMLTQAEFARRHGVSRQAIWDWVNRGVVQLVNGNVDEDQALAAIESVRDPARAGKILEGLASAKPGPVPADYDRPAPQQGEYAAAKTRREQAEASLAELKLRQQAGELIDAGKAFKAITDAATLIQSSIERVADKLAERVAAEADPDACHRIIKTECDAILADTSAAVRSLREHLHGEAAAS
jgi:transcriptional regulator with XRE-family HTH domain